MCGDPTANATRRDASCLLAVSDGSGSIGPNDRAGPEEGSGRLVAASSHAKGWSTQVYGQSSMLSL